jgi:hypothetical protein
MDNLRGYYYKLSQRTDNRLVYIHTSLMTPHLSSVLLKVEMRSTLGGMTIVDGPTITIIMAYFNCLGKIHVNHYNLILSLIMETTKDPDAFTNKSIDKILHGYWSLSGQDLVFCMASMIATRDRCLDIDFIGR